MMTVTVMLTPTGLLACIAAAVLPNLRFVAFRRHRPAEGRQGTHTIYCSYENSTGMGVTDSVCKNCPARGVSVTGKISDGSTKILYFGVQRFRNFGSRVEAHHERVGNFASERPDSSGDLARATIVDDCFRAVRYSQQFSHRRG